MLQDAQAIPSPASLTRSVCGNAYTDTVSQVLARQAKIHVWPAAAFAHVGSGRSDRPVSITPEVQALIAANAVVAIGVSGGKDSDACAIAVSRYLDQVGHTGPRVLIHSDLGRIEWEDSLPSCERLAAKLGWELMVVRRAAGDMLSRWQGRWKANLARYIDLSSVRLVLPWSTPALRFCTSELKSSVIASALRKRFPAHDIVSVTGIRRQESANRNRMPVSAIDKRLARKGKAGITWNAIIDHPIEDVLCTIKDAGLELHEAYRVYGASRVSCAFCIMSAAADLLAAASCQDNREVYLQLVELEIESTFGFQGARWLADVAPHWVSPELRARADAAKARVEARKALEAQIPKGMLYTAGWPNGMPSEAEAALLADVRRQMAQLLGLPLKYTTAEGVLGRYGELLAKKVIDEAKKAAKVAKATKGGCLDGTDDRDAALTLDAGVDPDAEEAEEADRDAESATGCGMA